MRVFSGLCLRRRIRFNRAWNFQGGACRAPPYQTSRGAAACGFARQRNYFFLWRRNRDWKLRVPTRRFLGARAIGMLWNGPPRGLALLAILAVAGCAGNGAGLDQNGQPIGSEASGSNGPLTADLQSIQDNVFTPICTRCHIGASAPEGLRLDAADSYNLLVGVPSAEVPSLLRVMPGDPDESYLVLKLQGSAGIVGGQMPLGGPYLPQSTIDAIRQWITDGAPNSASMQR
jgi:hypothetical protein